MGALYVTLAVHSLLQKSITADEFAHLPVGWNVLTTRDFHYCDLNPPLMNVLSAMPLLVMDISVTGKEGPPPEQFKYQFWANGHTFAAKYPAQYQRLFTAARCVTVLLVGLLGVLLLVWAAGTSGESAFRAWPPATRSTCEDRIVGRRVWVRCCGVRDVSP